MKLSEPDRCVKGIQKSFGRKSLASEPVGTPRHQAVVSTWHAFAADHRSDRIDGTGGRAPDVAAQRRAARTLASHAAQIGRDKGLRQSRKSRLALRRKARPGRRIGAARAAALAIRIRQRADLRLARRGRSRRGMRKPQCRRVRPARREPGQLICAPCARHSGRRARPCAPFRIA